MVTKIALIGFGVVGQGFTQILLEQKEVLKTKHGFEYEIVAISDTIKGSVYDENGLDTQKLLDIVEETGEIKSYPGGIKGWDSLKTIT